MEHKTYRAEIKAAADGAEPGTFTAVVSVFGNVDLGGDRVLPGAFTQSLADWQAKGDPIPVIWSHAWDNPDAHIGYVTSAKETPQGLEVQAKLDVERPFAAQVHHLLVNRRVTQFSFGYFAKDTQMVTEGDQTIREIKTIDLFEVGPTLLGMNPATELLQAASAVTRGAKAGRVLSAKNEAKVRAAYDALGEVLTALGEDGKSTPTITTSIQPTATIASANGYTSVTYSTGTSTTPAAKAAADEVKVGTFVEWTTNSGSARGQVEDVITDASYDIPETDFTVVGTKEDPALAIRVWRSAADGYVATNSLTGHKASTVTVIEDLPAPSKSQTASAPGDSPATLTPEQVNLLVRPRN